MNEDILVNITPQETRVALMQLGAVQELHIERTLSRGLVGNIYLGKVVRVLPGMQSAFIDIGLERAAFLRLHPVCKFCGAPSTTVDHIIRHNGDPALFWNRSNWQALCTRCHNSVKQRQERRPRP